MIQQNQLSTLFVLPEFSTPSNYEPGGREFESLRARKSLARSRCFKIFRSQVVVGILRGKTRWSRVGVSPGAPMFSYHGKNLAGLR